ncbi:ATP-dependent RNA helicase DbpA [Paenibacillus taihuensis]|uniref:ATP-dependent RNA helicase DbpA n=1 Tax=Paenibacillus taihuensis TaxID=1156355 RepID=A0A3D9QUW5_9BACL|nr:DEAD/DEAH box helicase [Paenibacillus taihuensis]REE68014.1 ATP-dependent RNA helicase DbpA [Paenibacillus taihuensis]
MSSKKTGFESYPLSEEIVRALDSLGYTEPTPVQREVIPQVLAQRDMTVRSQTGSGKTAAFGIPICELVAWEENKPQALILTPTRELAGQIKEDMINIGRFKRIKAVAIYGKQPFAQQRLELKQKVHVIAGTPGRVLDHIQRGTLQVEKLRYLVIDEADEMLSRGFIEQVEAIMALLPTQRLTLLFSATMPPDVERLCHEYMKSPVDIEIEAEGGVTVERITHTLYSVAQEQEKLELLRAITVTRNPDNCIVFCRMQETVDQVARQLKRWGYPCDKLHGGMEQNDRFSVMHAFRRREFRYLVATDLAARGIDIENITHVINYDLPMDKENFVHRIGRTGRAGMSGEAITFAVLPGEQRYLEEIESYIGFELPRAEMPTAEELAVASRAFEAKLGKEEAPRVDRRDLLSQDITKLYFGGGKKKKLRAVDFVGTIAKLEGITADDIGIISIEDNATFVDILNGKGQLVLQAMKQTTIKGKLLKVHVANK